MKSKLKDISIIDNNVISISKLDNFSEFTNLQLTRLLMLRIIIVKYVIRIARAM